jgi:hypothetical protein
MNSHINASRAKFGQDFIETGYRLRAFFKQQHHQATTNYIFLQVTTTCQESSNSVFRLFKKYARRRPAARCRSGSRRAARRRPAARYRTAWRRAARPSQQRGAAQRDANAARGEFVFLPRAARMLGRNGRVAARPRPAARCRSARRQRRKGRFCCLASCRDFVFLGGTSIAYKAAKVVDHSSEASESSGDSLSETPAP